MSEYVFAVSSLSTADPSNGVLLHLVEGEVWAANDPFVKARPDLFSSVPTKVRRTGPAPIEQASAAPGERRSVKRG